ncbi:MAG: methyltransferase domain-containing protein [Candidatus Rokubacteria bacterium]|nr:methyltransferase domain-containing protein [Candidatus Rokubacteria bacterium]
MRDVSAAAFWDGLYARGADGWEMGQPAPPLVDFVERTPPPRGRVAVPGCGRGHDARFLARHGYDVTGFDFSPAAIEAARALARAEKADVGFEARDVFSLAADYTHAFDGVWEYTCYCAIDPRRRDEYVRVLARIIRPGGWLLACFFPLRGNPTGPPFPVSHAEVTRRLARRFRIARDFAPTRSARGRTGRERVLLAWNVRRT